MAAVAILNAHMFGTPADQGEGVDWSTPDVMSEEAWTALLGMSPAAYAEASPHMIVWEVL